MEPSSRRLLLAGIVIGFCGGLLLSKNLFQTTSPPIPVITASDA